MGKGSSTFRIGMRIPAFPKRHPEIGLEGWRLGKAGIRIPIRKVEETFLIAFQQTTFPTPEHDILIEG